MDQIPELHKGPPPGTAGLGGPGEGQRRGAGSETDLPDGRGGCRTRDVVWVNLPHPLLRSSFSRVNQETASGPQEGAGSFSHQGRMLRLHYDGDYFLETVREFPESDEFSTQLGCARSGFPRGNDESLVYSFWYENEWCLLDAIAPHSQGNQEITSAHFTLELYGGALVVGPQSGEIRLTVSERTSVELAVFDVTGRRTATLIDRELTPGHYQAHWPEPGDYGSLRSGTYWVQLWLDNDSVANRKIILIR